MILSHFFGGLRDAFADRPPLRETISILKWTEKNEIMFNDPARTYMFLPTRMIWVLKKEMEQLLGEHGFKQILSQAAREYREDHRRRRGGKISKSHHGKDVRADFVRHVPGPFRCWAGGEPALQPMRKTTGSVSKFPTAMSQTVCHSIAITALYFSITWSESPRES